MNAMAGGVRALPVTLGLLLALPLPGLAAEKDESVVSEVLGILKERGIVDEAEYERLSLKNASYEQGKQKQGPLSKLEWFGDARIRLENFWFDDTSENDDFDRNRFRYRLRVGALVPVHEQVTAGFRLASGEDDIRSTNTSAGRANPDFDPDGIFIDQAFVELRPPAGWLGEDTSLKLVGGKQANPFLWKSTRDNLLWDPDITPEGGAFQLTHALGEQVSLFGNTGYFVLDENTSDKDPHVFGVQGGLAIAAAEDVEFGGRVSWYDWRSLDDDFFCRTQGIGSTTSTAGNLDGGLTDDGFCPTVGGFSSDGNDGFSAGELAGYLRYAGIESWPILVFGHLAQNFDAESVAGAGDQDLGWGVGVEVGDKKKYAMVGLGYYSLEANFWPSQFTDSDLFDGVTNREGIAFWISRQLFSNTELNVTLFKSDEIENDPVFADSVDESDRYRLQTDLVVKF